jgi:signal transduction histidine kinase
MSLLAHADRIEDETLRAGIRHSATDLVELSEKARNAEAVMQASTEAPEPIDLVDIARDVARQYRTEVPKRQITLSCPEELTISSHGSVVRKLLSELVANAVRHTDGSPPHVEISVRSHGETTVEIAVTDDGPGIPERERTILSYGSETPLDHGRGVGLWTLKWAVTQLGGELAFEGNDPEGSIVTVRLQDPGTRPRTAATPSRRTGDSLSGATAGGLRNVSLTGPGTVSLSTHGEPLLLMPPVNTDPDATVAWSGNLSPSLARNTSLEI